MSRLHATALTALVLVACYIPTLQGMFKQWWTDEDMSHGFAVPVVILWIIWRERSRWQTLETRPSAWGFALLAAAWAADGAPRTAAETLDRAAALAPTPAVRKRIAAMRQTLPAR